MAEPEGISRWIEQRLSRNYSRFFGFELEKAEPGAVTLSLPQHTEFEHETGWFEGTITSAVAQAAASHSAISLSRSDWVHLVLDRTIRFVGAAQGERLAAMGKVTQFGRMISFAGADVYTDRDGERHLYAQLQMTVRHAPPSD